VWANAAHDGDIHNTCPVRKLISHRAFFMRKRKEMPMPKKETQTGGAAGTPGSALTNTVDQRRKRLARLIGRLLARTWLKQRRDLPVDSRSSGRAT